MHVTTLYISQDGNIGDGDWWRKFCHTARPYVQLGGNVERCQRSMKRCENSQVHTNGIRNSLPLLLPPPGQRVHQRRVWAGAAHVGGLGHHEGHEDPALRKGERLSVSKRLQVSSQTLRLLTVFTSSALPASAQLGCVQGPDQGQEQVPGQEGGCGGILTSFFPLFLSFF